MASRTSTPFHSDSRTLAHAEPPSRALFTPAQIDADRGRFEGEQFEVEQSDDGGGEFHFRRWKPVQSAEWRHCRPRRALHDLREDGRP
ncbi:hypothetical protein IQ62_28300 [Streptomyces scabiei]|nr:hypothetical protein IQ62_28300 [Streptomyces scabiei]